MYWAQALAAQTTDVDLQKVFAPLAKALSDSESEIMEELNSVQGAAQDIDGYYFADRALATTAMRPSKTLNEALSSVTAG